MEKRKQPGLEIKLAATLLQLGHIEYEHAKLMSARQICSLYVFDHWPIRHEAGGPAEPWNLTPRLIVPHRTKTAKIDAPQIAKIRHLRAIAPALVIGELKHARTKPTASRWAGRKLQSRPFQKKTPRR